MTIEEAYNNLNQILIFGRITMPNGPLNGQEHVELSQNLRLLYNGAKENQETKKVADGPKPVEKGK